MASPPEGWDGTQKIVTVEVMRSFYCGSSADPHLREIEESEQLPVDFRRRQVSETPSPPLSPVPPPDELVRVPLCCCYCFVYSHLLLM